jgi:hypothetical protein
MGKCKNIECNNETIGKRVYCSLTCRNVYVNKYLRDYSKNGAGISGEKGYYENPKKCLKCDSILKYEQRRGDYCGHGCAASVNNIGRIYSLETREKIAKASSVDNIKRWKDPEYVKKCLITIGKRRFNSKGEIEVRNHFINKFPEHEWTCGGFIYHGTDRMITSDLYSKKLKICVEYDGAWHFKDINGQLKKKQMKDKMLNEWCAKNGYRIIRISEDYYKKNKSLSLEKLEKEILFGKKKLVKFY